MSESLPQFRIGGVYRQKNGVAVVLSDDKHNPGPGTAWVHRVGGDYGEGFRCLTTGRDTIQLEEDGRDLIPGELHQVNGEWVPMQGAITFPSGATLTTSGDKIVGRVEPESTLDELIAYALALATDVPSEPEPIRPPLTWNTETPFDTFKGFDVVSIGIDYASGVVTPAFADRPAPKGSTLHAHPGKDAALLRG